MSTHTSKACCERPAAIAENYTPQGTYHTIGDTRCYITGPKDARKAIYFIYDVFGFTNPSLQGADILASKGKEPYLVLMPDLFDGQPIQPEWFADKDANKEKISAFMSKLQDPAPHVQRVLDILAAAKEGFTGIQSWGTIGYCWGGKLASLTAGPDSPWRAAVSSSPARIDPRDAEKCTVPFATLASKDENSVEVYRFHAALTTEKIVHVFKDQIHGWMSARVDLKDDKVKAGYERGYQIALEFFGEHL